MSTTVGRPERPLLADVLPELARELEEGLRAAHEPALAASVSRLRVVDRCRCGDDFCATFYTAPPPQGAYDLTHRNIPLDPAEGMIILDVERERIACVEVLYRDPIRRRLFEICP